MRWLLVALALLVVGIASKGMAAGDAGGYKTGNAADVMDAEGNKFVVPEPPKGAKPAEVKAYQAFQAQAKREPLAMKLADAVGQNRVAST